MYKCTMCWWGELRSWFHNRSTVICFRLSMSSPLHFADGDLGGSLSVGWFMLPTAPRGLATWLSLSYVHCMEPGDGLITQKYWVTKLLEGWWVGELPSNPIPMMKQLHSSILLSSQTRGIKTICHMVSFGGWMWRAPWTLKSGMTFRCSSRAMRLLCTFPWCGWWAPSWRVWWPPQLGETWGFNGCLMG